MSAESRVPAARAEKAPSGYADALRRLADAQKVAARSAPAYSRFVNRRFGRFLAAGAYVLGMTPNAVTAVSAVFTFSGILLLALFPPSWILGIVVALCLLVGYAFDSADGQLARLRKSSSPSGEWLDHMVDALKVSSMPLAVAIGFYRFDVVPTWWLLVPLAYAAVWAVLFFGMILTEQLRRQHGRISMAVDREGRPSWIRSILVLPMDYGVLCISFVFLGALPVFLVLYTLIFLATAGFLLLASISWFRQMRELTEPAHETTAGQR